MWRRCKPGVRGERCVCPGVPWETLQMVQHQMQSSKKVIMDNVWTALNDTKEELQQNLRAHNSTIEQLRALTEEATSRVVSEFESRLQELEDRLTKRLETLAPADNTLVKRLQESVDNLSRRQNDTDQRLSLQPLLLKITGFLKTDSMIILLLAAGEAFIILLVVYLHLCLPGPATAAPATAT